MHETKMLDTLYQWMQDAEKAVSEGKKQNQMELRLLKKGLELLKLNHRAGDFVKEREHPKPYLHYRRVLDGKKPVALWKLDVHPKYRLIYITVADSECPEEAKFKPTQCIIIDFLHHNKYNKVFGYKG